MAQPNVANQNAGASSQAPSTTIAITEMPDIEKVHQLIKAMYEQQELKDFASKWLEELQKSVYAWKVSDQLLLQRADYQSCYFASQTLKTKIQQSFNELPVESYDSLKDSIINHLLNMNEKPIQTQLSLSLAYIFYMNPHWNNSVEELSNKLPKNVFLEILICIAQEFDESRPTFKISKKRRTEIEEYLSEHFSHVIQMLLGCFQESFHFEPSLQEQISQKCFTCFEAWLTFAKSTHIELIKSMLMILMNYLKNPQCSSWVHEKAADALCKVIYQCEAHSAFTELRANVIEQVYSLENSYQLALSVEDSKKLIDLARIFSELGNSAIEFLIYDQVDAKILNLILNCVAHYEFEIAEVTFSFWYNFSELVYKHNSLKFFSYYNLLLSSLTRHCQIESDFDGVLDEKSDVFEYRVQINDLIQEIVVCTDWVDYIKSMKIIETIKSSMSWEIIEVHLFILYCIACEKESFNRNQSKNEVLPQIAELILSLPSQHVNHVQIQATACEFFGELSQWINENPAVLQPTVSYLLNLINSNFQKTPKLSTKAAVALKQIINEMTVVLDFSMITNLFVELVRVYSQVEDQLEFSGQLLACCTAIISNSNIENSVEQEYFVEQLIQLILAKIAETANNTNKPSISSDAQKPNWEKIINNIYAVFKNFRPNQKTKNSQSIHNLLREQIWPFLKEAILQFASSDSQVIEHCSRCVRHIVRSMKPSYLLQPIVDHIVPLYQQFPMNSSLLYIGSVLVDEFADKNDPIMTQGLVRMLNAFSLSTFHFLNETNISMNPYTIDDYFNLCTRILTKLTDEFMSNNPEILNGILKLLLMSVYLPQKEANDSLMRFLCEFLKIDHPIKNQYLFNNTFGRDLFFALIDSIMFKLPSYFIPDMSDSVWAFKSLYPDLYKDYLQYTTTNLYDKIQKDGYSVTDENLENFYQSLISATNPKRLVSELRFLQRLINS